MKTLSLILVAASLTVGACDFGAMFGSESETSLFVSVDSRNNPATHLANPMGLAGLRVEISGIGQRVTLTASDFAGVADPGEGYLIHDVPNHGAANVAIMLVQGDAIVANGEVSLRLQPRTDSWHITLTRTDHAWGSDLINQGGTGCVDHLMFCQRVVRFLISEAAANEPDEAIWLMVQRITPDGPCPDAGPNAICGE